MHVVPLVQVLMWYPTNFTLCACYDIYSLFCRLICLRIIHCYVVVRVKNASSLVQKYWSWFMSVIIIALHVSLPDNYPRIYIDILMLYWWCMFGLPKICNNASHCLLQRWPNIYGIVLFIKYNEDYICIQIARTSFRKGHLQKQKSKSIESLCLSLLLPTNSVLMSDASTNCASRVREIPTVLSSKGTICGKISLLEVMYDLWWCYAEVNTSFLVLLRSITFDLGTLYFHFQ